MVIISSDTFMSAAPIRGNLPNSVTIEIEIGYWTSRVISKRLLVIIIIVRVNSRNLLINELTHNLRLKN